MVKLSIELDLAIQVDPVGVQSLGVQKGFSRGPLESSRRPNSDPYWTPGPNWTPTGPLLIPAGPLPDLEQQQQQHQQQQAAAAAAAAAAASSSAATAAEQQQQLLLQLRIGVTWQEKYLMLN